VQVTAGVSGSGGPEKPAGTLCKALYRSSILLAASIQKSRSGALFGVPLTDVWTPPDPRFSCPFCVLCVFGGVRAASGKQDERRPEGLVEAVGDVRVQLGEEVAVAVESDLDARMAHASLNRLGVGALGDGQRHGRMSEVVEPEAVEPDLRLGRLPVGGVEARRVDRVAGPVGKDQRILAGLRVRGQVLSTSQSCSASSRGSRCQP
jgi:hypothetical protein